MNARNPKHNAAGTIDLEIEHPEYGWVPFTASPDDAAAAGADLYAAAMAGDYGPIAEYAPPSPAQQTTEQTEALRKAAYQAEADPLFFKYQRGEATREEWLAKVDEIRARYP